MKRYTVTKRERDGTLIAEYETDELLPGPSGFVYDAPIMTVTLNYAVSRSDVAAALAKNEGSDS